MSDLRSSPARLPPADRASRTVRWMAVGLVATMLVALAPAVLGGTPTSAPRAAATGATGAPAAVPAASRSAAPTAGPTGRVSFPASGPHPSAWGPSGIPPGADALPLLAARSGGGGWGGGGGAGNGSAANWDNRFCAGVWPGFPTLGGDPQGTYANGCYGHDEPGIQFFSTLPGSGGNVSWNVTLPVDRGGAYNQSDLYSAIWFGMTLNDPYAWLDQCFLELQFYPDQTFYNPGPLFPGATVNGAWIGAAVAWQIDAAGNEDPCFYEPLYLNGAPGPAFLNMTQGDTVRVTMTGWTGSATGETVSVLDTTNGFGSNLTLYNATGGYPLDPSYATNAYENGLQWTPGGEYPVVFAFETGHAGNYNWPSNNSYGGCSPGPRGSPRDPAAPCPSYDPGAWANDTLVPWAIRAPTFFNATATARAAQVGFTQDFGGISLDAQLSGGTCDGATGSAGCSYPWYSYSCRAHAFAFGATDYAGVSDDFGQYDQYATGLVGNALGFGFYPPTNFSVPTCAAPSYTVDIGSSGAAGAAYFLSHAYAGAAVPVGGLGAGTYALAAIPAAGASFDRWVATGGVHVATPTSAATSVDVRGAGNVTAVFTTTPRLTLVTFANAPKGWIGVDPSPTFTGPFTGTGAPIGSFASGQSVALPSGRYSIQAYPPIGYNFTRWSVNGSGAVVAAAELPYTWLTVTGAASAVTVSAQYTRSTAGAIAELIVVGNGTATLGTLTVTNSASPYAYGLAHPRLGTYPLRATPGAGADTVQWVYGPSAAMTNFSASTLVTLQAGFSYVEAIFGDTASVGVAATPAALGRVALLDPGSPATANGSVALPAGSVATIAAEPLPNASFTGWSVTGGVLVANASAILTALTVTGAGTVTAHFAAATGNLVGTGSRPADGGAMELDGAGGPIAGGAANLSVADGLHWANATAAPGWDFAGWTVTRGVALVGPSTATEQAFVVNGTGTILANFVPGRYPVTFVAWEPEGGAPSNATLTVGTTVLASGETVWLSGAAAYHATLTGPDDAVQTWSATSNLTVLAGGAARVAFSVNGSGTIYALVGDSDHDANVSGAAAPVPGAGTSGSPATTPGAFVPTLAVVRP